MSAKTIEENEGSLSELFEILSHKYRRRILVAVAQHNPQDEDDITSESIADEHEEDGDARDLLHLQLYHAHLPKLADAGFINWDRDTSTITRGARFKKIAPLLRLMRDHQDELPDDWP
ncbi:DUF7344 domain-containing protein [Halorussus halophilus]|uniref:DUF7344 domain-containing protein n=1 Tax=Halorussus halophilus TaxID=2650975 RepID=UPI001CE49E31|nr:ArsR family transcriptional regulator [Halorussus halophilus]